MDGFIFPYFQINFLESVTYFLKILQNIETSIDILGCVQWSQSYLMGSRCLVSLFSLVVLDGNPTIH